MEKKCSLHMNKESKSIKIIELENQSIKILNCTANEIPILFINMLHLIFYLYDSLLFFTLILSYILLSFLLSHLVPCQMIISHSTGRSPRGHP